MDFINTFFLSFYTCIATPLFCMEQPEQVITPRTREEIEAIEREELKAFKAGGIRKINNKVVRESDDIVEHVNSFLAAKRAIKLEKLKKKLQHVSSDSFHVNSDSDDDVRNDIFQSCE